MKWRGSQPYRLFGCPLETLWSYCATVPLCHCAADLRVLSVWIFFFGLCQIAQAREGPSHKGSSGLGFLPKLGGSVWERIGSQE